MQGKTTDQLRGSWHNFSKYRPLIRELVTRDLNVKYRRSFLIAALYHHREQEGWCAAGLYQLRKFFFGNVQNGHRHKSRRELLLLIKDLVIPVNCVKSLFCCTPSGIASPSCPISVLQPSRDILILSKNTE